MGAGRSKGGKSKSPLISLRKPFFKTKALSALNNPIDRTSTARALSAITPDLKSGRQTDFCAEPAGVEKRDQNGAYIEKR